MPYNPSRSNQKKQLTVPGVFVVVKGVSSVVFGQLLRSFLPCILFAFLSSSIVKVG
ncbi:MAG: hypothetical protein OFPI_14380 [Osedax symbiont Rs2]|nr:MAG: hypothetical protein OFPI_14380 [Osedax symbiont Rs2]